MKPLQPGEELIPCTLTRSFPTQTPLGIPVVYRTFVCLIRLNKSEDDLDRRLDSRQVDELIDAWYRDILAPALRDVFAGFNPVCIPEIGLLQCNLILWRGELIDKIMKYRWDPNGRATVQAVNSLAIDRKWHHEGITVRVRSLSAEEDKSQAPDYRGLSRARIEGAMALSPDDPRLHPYQAEALRQLGHLAAALGDRGKRNHPFR